MYQDDNYYRYSAAWSQPTVTSNRPRMTRTKHTGIVPTSTYARESWKGTRVLMILKGGKFVPVDGRFVKVQMGKLEVNVLCHDTDKDPPKNYKIG